MISQTESKTVKRVPDTATTYERAKPSQESPGGRLDQKETGKGSQPDQLAKNNREPAGKTGE